MAKYLGIMHIARNPCGRVAAALWEEGFNDIDLAATIKEWREAGLSVERVERYRDDPQIEWICQPGCQCKEAA